MTPDQYCQEKAVQSGSSFYYSFLFLPAAQRRAITALYALCRELDDTVDGISEPDVARIKLAWWRSELDKLFAGHPEHPVTKALQPHLAPFDMTPARLMAIVDGMEMDLNQNRYLDYPALRRYCWHVAGVVGELSAGIFGYQDPSTLQFAAKLGEAFQLTNILRDVGDDARHGRIYLPIDALQAHQVKANDILNRQYSKDFQSLMQTQFELAQRTYREALALLPDQDRRAQRPGLMMAAIYYNLLLELRASDFQVLHQRISLTPLRKLWLAWKAYVSQGRSTLKLIGR
ncbi:MAG: presqualene diphosphate synthase HpnD [Pigmentiphaga sp.]|nr:presqualene diphosphate synthase HpnD [Pigmentiphaga sp.]